MLMRAHRLALSLAVCFVTVVVAGGAASAEGRVSLVDQGWRIVDQAGERTVELNTILVNESQSPLEYEVRFIVECSERVPQTYPAPRSMAVSNPTGHPWLVYTTISVLGGPLAPGASAAVEVRLPYELLTAGRYYRFRPELIDHSTDALVASAKTTSQASPFLAGAEFAALAVLSRPLLGGHTGAAVSGAGIMTGEHEAHRADGEWIERGSGTIEASTRQGRLVLEYAYSSHGTSTATLVATATATGQLIRPSGEAVPVEITSASAQMTFPGARQDVGPIIRRSGATATGTFTGTVGDELWTGLLTMRNGTQTLDPTTGRGQHSFDIQFTASP